MHLDFGNLLQKSISSHREERVRHQRFKRVPEAAANTNPNPQPYVVREDMRGPIADGLGWGVEQNLLTLSGSYRTFRFLSELARAT